MLCWLPRLVICAAILPVPTAIHAEVPLHDQIDRLIAARADGPFARRTNDAEFLRRIYLDLAGRIPTVEEARRFLENSSPEKRAELIDHLLDGPDYPRRMTEWLDVLLLERLGSHSEWTAFLRQVVETNQPWDQIVGKILDPSAEDEATRGSALFLTKRLEHYGQNPIDFPGLTRDIGRLFLGIDVQCAQCHDHPQIFDYKQKDYQGLYAFVSHTFIRRDQDFPAVGEKLVKDRIEYQSVFLLEKEQTGPRLPDGQEIAIPTFEPGEEYAQPPDRKTNFPGIPKFRPLAILAERLPHAENTAFVRNSVNRFWFLMMGRGLVHPLDLHHSDNPPSHPELLDLLEREFAAHDFDIQWFLRELALSETYQRSSRLPDGIKTVPEHSFRVAPEKFLSAEQLMWSMLQATGELSRYQGQAETSGSKQEALEHVRQSFRDAFANPPREPETELAPTLRAALFVLNSEMVLDWLQPRDGNLAERILQKSDPKQMADELYLSVLTRWPTDEEYEEVAGYLQQRPDCQAEAVEHLIWAMLASTEFCMNH